MTNEDALLKIAEDLFNQTKRKHDLYYREGYGVLVVPHGYALHPRNIVSAISEGHLEFIKMSRGHMNISFK